MAFFALSAANAQAAYEDWSYANPSLIGLDLKFPGISCTAANACVAAGLFQELSFPPAKRVPLLVKWNGASWEREFPPAIAESEATLAGVSCTSATECIAVGTYKKNVEAFKALAQVRTGVGWGNSFPPNPIGALETKLEGVSCTSSSACTAVGFYKNVANETFTLAERWNGKSWAIQTTSNPVGEDVGLTGVSCLSATECVAVGYRETGEGKVFPLAERWNGATWELLSPKVPPEGVEARLEEVSCAAVSGACIAVGNYKNYLGKKLTLAERWSSGEGWTIQSTPNPGGAEEASLTGISCPTETACTATGSYKASAKVKPLGERLAGKTWALTLPEDPGEGEALLAAASCISIHLCMAAGHNKKEEPGWVYPLVEKYEWFQLPENTAKPTASPATPETGKAVTATTGTWTEEPTSYTFQWKRCNASGLECVNLSGETKSTYYPLDADVEKTLVVEVTAKNPAGSAAATSIATGKVKKAGTIAEYGLPASSNPRGIAPGPDGNLWFANGATNKIGKATTAGSVTEYSTTGGSGSEPTGIAKGPDGNLWFSFSNAQSRVAKITTSGTVTRYELAKAMTSGKEIASGPDGNLWFTATEGRVGKITTAGAFTSYEVSGQPTGITAGPDGNIWLTRYSTNKVSRMTPGGFVTDFSLPTATSPYGITLGPDEKLWFGASGKVGKISTLGVVTEYGLPAAGEVRGITEGPDGLLWFAHYGADKIGKITTGGTITEYSLPSGSKPWDVAAGSDGNIWFTLSGSNRIGMIEP